MDGFVVEGLVAHHATVVVVGLVVGMVDGFSVHQTIGVLGLVVGLLVVDDVDHQGVQTVVGFDDEGFSVHQGLVVGLPLVGFVVVVHQADVVVFLVVPVVHSPCMCSVEDAPESTPVVVSGGAGVEGAGGLVQSPGVGPSDTRPNS